MENKIFIIAEAGVNHNGHLDLAKKLVDAAVYAGADAVKFQTFKPESLVSTQAPKAKYQIENTGSNESQLEMIKKLELNYSAQKELAEYCKQKKICFLSSPFDLESIDFLSSIGLETYKIPSGEITNYIYLKKIGALKKKIILSSGMSTLGEIETALDILSDAGTPISDITVLHCTSEYPASLEDINLKAMLTIQNAFGVRVGYSDHTIGIEIPVAAAALGAMVIEKHFTLDKTMEGPDHKASLDPEELKKMVDAIRAVELALGSVIKKPTSVEIQNRMVVRKSIVAKTVIAEGEAFTHHNITVKRPGTGIPANRWDEIIGKNASRNFDVDEMIEL